MHSHRPCLLSFLLCWPARCSVGGVPLLLAPQDPHSPLHSSAPSTPLFTQVLPEVKAKEEEEKKRAEEERAKLAELLKASRCCLWLFAGL